MPFLLITMEDALFLTDGLSFDAAPVVISYLSDLNHSEQGEAKNTEILTEKEKEDYCARYCRRILKQQADRSFRDFNYSYYQAAQTVKQYQ
jgi:hypothetical protein